MFYLTKQLYTSLVNVLFNKTTLLFLILILKWGWNVADNSPCSFCLDGVFNYVQFARRFGLYIAKKYNYYFYRICVEGVVHNSVHGIDKNYIYIYYRISVEGVVHNYVHEEDKNYIYIYYRISVEGVVHNSVHEVDKNLNYEFIWNKRDAYGRKVYGQVKHLFRNIHFTLKL